MNQIQFFYFSFQTMNFFIKLLFSSFFHQTSNPLIFLNQTFFLFFQIKNTSLIISQLLLYSLKHFFQHNIFSFYSPTSSNLLSQFFLFKLRFFNFFISKLNSIQDITKQFLLQCNFLLKTF